MGKKLTFSILLLTMFLVLAFSVSATATAPDSDDVVLELRFEDSSTTLDDTSANTNDFTTYNSPTAEQTGILNYAYDFENDTKQYAKADDHSTFDITDDISLSVWLKPESFESFESAGWYKDNILVKAGSSGTRSWGFYGTDGYLTFASTESGTSWIITSTTNSHFSTGSWVHVGIAFDNSENNVEFFVDGVSVENVTHTTSGIYSSSQDVFLGTYGGAEATYSFDTMYDELLLFDAKLSGSNMRYLYADGSPSEAQEYNFSSNSTLPTITSQTATDIGKTNVTLESVFVFEDATWIDSYFKINTVEQTHTNSTSATTHDRTFTGLDWETEYNYTICIVSDISSELCDSVSTFTTLDRTPPYINIANDFDVEITTASIGGTFFFEDFTNITAYAVIDGVNQTQQFYASGTSQYYKEDFTGLSPNTTYNFDWCISYENGEICDGADSFTTDSYTLPYVNALNFFDITNHESSFGATVFYGSYENMTLHLNHNTGTTTTSQYNQADEFDVSEYYTKNYFLLDYDTTYNYSLDISYIDPNSLGASDSDWVNEYRVNGTNKVFQIAFCDERIGNAGWTDLNLRRVTSSQECVDLCNRFYGDPLLNNVNATLTHTDYHTPYYANAYITEGQGTCWYIDNSPYDECFIGVDGSFIAPWSGATSSDALEMDANIPITRYVTGVQYDYTTLDAYEPSISISGAYPIYGTSVTLTGTFYPRDYYSIQPYFNMSGTIYNATEIVRPTYYNETLYSQIEHASYEVTGFEMNTTYETEFCILYDDNYSETICDGVYNFTTTFEPTFTWGTVDITMADSLTWDWSFDFNNVYLVEYSWNGTGAWLVAPDGATKTCGFTGLEPETNYTAYVGYRYIVEFGDDYIYQNSSDNTARTYYANAFDDVWDGTLQGSTIAKLLLGFAVLLGITFLGVGLFGQLKLELGMFGIMFLIIVGTIIATLMKLFPVYILLLVIGGAVLLAVLKNMFFNGGGENR